MTTDLNDIKLLNNACRGDETAFLGLYKRHRDDLYRFVYRFLNSSELAEDITHDCFLSLIRQPDRYDPALASLRTYLYAAARNLSLKHIRQTGGEVTIDDLPEDTFVSEIDPPLQSLLGKEMADLVRRAVTDLPPLQREALILFEYEELTLMEIAAIVATDIGTVKSRLHRARERLRRSLSPYYKSRPLLTVSKAG